MTVKYEIEKFNENNFSSWKMKKKAILKKKNYLAAIWEMIKDITDNVKWNEMDGNAIIDPHLAMADEELFTVEEKRKNGVLLQNCTRHSLYTVRFS